MMAKTIYRMGMTPAGLIFFQNLLAIPFLLVLAIRHGGPLRMEPPDLKKIAGMSLLGGTMTPLLLYSSYNYIPAGSATTLHFVYPLFVFAGCVVLFKHRVQFVQGGCVVLCTAGIFLFYDRFGGSGLFGQLIAVLSGITYAAYIIFLDKSGVSSIPLFKRSLYVCFTNMVIVFCFAAFSGQLTWPRSPMAWVLCLVFTVTHSICAVALFQTGTFLVGPQRAAIFSTLEPITSIAIGIALYRDIPTLRIAVGGVLILFASTFLAVYGNKQEKAPVVPNSSIKE